MFEYDLAISCGRAMGKAGIINTIGRRVENARAKDKNCDARPSRLFLGLSQHLKCSPCPASGLRTTVFSQLRVETEI